MIYFRRNRTNDPFHWIPQGLFYDLMDTTNDMFPVIDQVSGYTNEEIFNAFNSSTKSMSQYKSRLLQLYGTAQAIQINNLFESYHY